MTVSKPLVSFVIVGGDPGDPVTLLGAELLEAEVLVVGRDAPADPRIRALPAQDGLDEARNVALDAAAGEYVWFLEGSPAPGAIAAVAERLRATAPDVLLADRGAHRRVLERVTRDGVTTLDRRRGLAAAAPHLGDKLLRRAHLRNLGLRFVGDELSVTWPALLTAERIAAAPGARCPVGPETPGAYDAVFAFLAAHPEVPDERRRLLLPAMLRRELALLQRLPAAERPARFAALSECWRRHRRGDEPIGGGRVARLRVRLVALGAYRAYAAVEAARTGPRAVSWAKRRVRRRLGEQRRRRLEHHYRARLRVPLDPDLAVFAAYWYRGYACNPQAIYEKAR
jgi:CDP-glycerol glycerophosphotransferase